MEWDEMTSFEAWKNEQDLIYFSWDEANKQDFILFQFKARKES